MKQATTPVQGIEQKNESNYVTNANKVLADMGIKFKATFIKNSAHFDGDKLTRDIFRVTLSRVGKRFSVRFGQSIIKSDYKGGNPPTAYDVLASLTKSDPESFDWFCKNYGYDEDSRKAEKIYKAVCKEWKQVSNFFTPHELEILQEIN